MALKPKLKLSLYSVLSDLQQARTISDLESIAIKNLKQQISIIKIKFLFNQSEIWKSKVPDQLNLKFYESRLEISNYPEATVIYYRDKKFTKPEQNFLAKVSNALSINIDRLIKIERAKQLRAQWNASFDAISTPICLTNEEFCIVTGNQSFYKLTKSDPTTSVSKNAFSVFLGSSDISFKTQQGKNYFTSTVKKIIDGETAKFEIHCQLITNPLIDKLKNKKQYLIMFKDITEQMKIEKQIIESAKMAELGTIGSSIAHELNNPLSGMLTFSQVIKMDLDKSSKYLEDINSIEKAIYKCRDIVENLLGFCRKQNINDFTQVNLNNVLEKSIKLNSLQTKSEGIKIISNFDLSSPVYIKGNENLLTQAFGHIIQEAIDHIKASTNKLNPQNITIELEPKDGKAFVRISDSRISENNFDPFSTSKTLGLTVAYKILTDHQAVFELFSQPKAGKETKITFERLDLLDVSQVFDG